MLAIATISISHREDEMMHGEGMLCWSDDFGVCRYKVVLHISWSIIAIHGPCFRVPIGLSLKCPQGTFEHNVFQGHGVLEWSVKAEQF